MNISPKNRHMLVETVDTTDDSKPQILVPDDYVQTTAKEHELVKVLALAPDCSASTHEALGLQALVEGHMIKKVEIAGKEYKLVLENYMLAAVEDAKA